MKRISLAVFAAFLGAGDAAFAEDLSIEQRVLAERMKGIVLMRAVAVRIRDMCADVEVDEARLAAERDHVLELARERFASQTEAMGEDMRRFFADRGLVWTSSSAEYCGLAEALAAAEAPVANYLILRE